MRLWKDADPDIPILKEAKAVREAAVRGLKLPGWRFCQALFRVRENHQNSLARDQPVIRWTTTEDGVISDAKAPRGAVISVVDCPRPHPLWRSNAERGTFIFSATGKPWKPDGDGFSRLYRGSGPQGMGLNRAAAL